LKDNPEFAPAYGRANELVTVFVPLVSPNLEIGKETFDSLFEGDAMHGKFVVVEIIFKV